MFKIQREGKWYTSDHHTAVLINKGTAANEYLKSDKLLFNVCF